MYIVMQTSSRSGQSNLHHTWSWPCPLWSQSLLLPPAPGNLRLGCWPQSFLLLSFSFLFFKDIIYPFMIDTEREAETQAEGEAGFSQGARCGTRSQTPGSCPEPKADAQPLSPPGALISPISYRDMDAKISDAFSWDLSNLPCSSWVLGFWERASRCTLPPVLITVQQSVPWKALFSNQIMLLCSQFGWKAHVTKSSGSIAMFLNGGNCHWFLALAFFFFFKIFFSYSWETHRGRDIGRGRSRLPVGSPM